MINEKEMELEFSEQIEGVEGKFGAVETLSEAVDAQMKIKEAKEKQNEIDEISSQQISVLEEKIKKLRDWNEEAKKEYVDREQFYAHRLEFYLRDQIESGALKNKKSIALPFGKIQMKKQQPQYNKNNQVLMEYAEAAGHVKVQKQVDWSEIKKGSKVVDGKLIDSDGVVISGVEVVERPDVFSLVIDE